MPTPIELDELGDEAGIRLSGELDASNAPTVSATLLKHADRATEVTVDVTGLRFIDSAGMNVLIAAAQRLEGRGRLTIRCLSEGPVRRVLGLMGLSDVLAHVDLDERVEGIGA